MVSLSRFSKYLFLTASLMAAASPSAIAQSSPGYFIPPSAAPAPRPAPVAAPAPDSPVVFTAAKDGIWVKFYDGHGQQLLQKVMALGESYTALDAYIFTLAGWLAGDDVEIAEFPVIADHYRRMSERPSVVRALAAESA